MALATRLHGAQGQLAVADVPGYLHDPKLVSPEAVVDGGLRVVDASRGNRVFVVTAERARGLVLKVAGEAGDPGVAHDAAVLQRLRSLDAGGALMPFLPVLVAYDADLGALIVEAAPAARDLVAHHRRGRFSIALARKAGRALGTLHPRPARRSARAADLRGPRLEARHAPPGLATIQSTSATALT
jgi:hypothetical protein